MKTGILLLAIFRGLMFVAALISAIIYATRKLWEERQKKKIDSA